jgi:type IV pilus assembly protein PilB
VEPAAPARIEVNPGDDAPPALPVELPANDVVAEQTPAPRQHHQNSAPPLRSVRVGEQLVETNVISRAQLDEALEHQRLFGGRIVDTLIQLEHMTAEAFLVFMGNRPGIPRIVLANYAWLSREVLELIPAEMATELEVIPIDRLGKTISVAMVCPIDLDALERIQAHTGLKIRPLLCSRPEFRTALSIHYGQDLSSGRAVRK